LKFKKITTGIVDGSGRTKKFMNALAGTQMTTALLNVI
jgi:hypothetical protein